MYQKFLNKYFVGFIVVLLLALGNQVRAADSIYIIYDSSNSMWGELADKSRKYETGRAALASFLQGDFKGKDLALRIYGHRWAGDCRDSELVTGFTPAEDAKLTISDAVNAARPTGKTPINYSLRESLKDFGDRTGSILLISDGLETCDADPCALMQAWKDSNVNIAVHVVGFGLKQIERGQLSCIADISGGTYYDANSADELAAVLEQAREIVVATPAEAVETGTGSHEESRNYDVDIDATDMAGQKLTVAGTLWQDGKQIAEVNSYTRFLVEKDAEYILKMGALLEDGSIYDLAETSFVASEFTSYVDIVVPTPARVHAKFMEAGEEHRGSLVRAFADGEKIFNFRAKDTALYRAGTYEFTATPNPDNPMKLSGILVAGEDTELLFDLSKTVAFHIEFKLPNGEIVKRNSELWLEGVVKNKVHANNGGRAQPGVFELHSDGRGVSLIPVQITIADVEEQTIIVPLAVGFINVSYEDSEHYIKTADRARIEAVDFKGGPVGRINVDLAVTPGAYEVLGWAQAGYFEPIIVDVELNKVTHVVIKPAPLGTVIVTYAAGDYKREPKRVELKVADDSPFGGKSSGVGTEIRVPAGKYVVMGSASYGDIVPQDITLGAGETLQIILKLK